MAKKKTRKSSGKKKTVRRAAAASIATTTTSHTPTHLVLFRRPSEANTALCAKMGLQAAGGVSSIRTGVTLLSHGKRGESPSRLYANLGLLVTDLAEGDIKAYQDSDEVETVVKNEVRTLPPPLEDRQEPTRVADPLVAYLQGMHDATAAALRYAGELADASSVPVGLIEAASADYPLGMIGIDDCASQSTGSGVTVAVLDTGIDLSHPDFAGRLRESDNAVSFVPGERVQDGHGHGTHCAGSVAGPLQSIARRRYGVAPDVDLLIGKVLSDAGRGTDDQIIDGIDWAATSGARIISMSLGASRAAGEPASIVYERIAQNLMASGSGTLIIAAAGNASARPHFVAPVGDPAAAKSIMAVAAVDQRRQVAGFSSGQRDTIGEINIAAPGVRIFSSWTGGGYRSISGTSMATPHVAGIAALYLEQTPGLTPTELWRQLENRASAAGDQADLGHGIVHAP